MLLPVVYTHAYTQCVLCVCDMWACFLGPVVFGCPRWYIYFNMDGGFIQSLVLGSWQQCMDLVIPGMHFCHFSAVTCTSQSLAVSPTTWLSV